MPAAPALQRAAGPASRNTSLGHSPRPPRLSRRPSVGVRAAERNQQQQPNKSRAKGREEVEYGENWYEQTRARPRTVREELEYRRAANLAANNGKERKDLYTDNWDGSEWKGGGFNILTLVGLLFILVPVTGLAFAYFTYGDLWG